GLVHLRGVLLRQESQVPSRLYYVDGSQGRARMQPACSHPHERRYDSAPVRRGGGMGRGRQDYLDLGFIPTVERGCESLRKLPPKFLAAMIAVRALPGSPLYDGDDDLIVSQAISDLERYKSAGVDSVILENDHDLPYVQPPICGEAIGALTTVASEVRRRFDGPVGIQILEAANESALEVACRTGLDFLRVEGYCFAHVGGAGIIQGSAGRLLRLRKALGCEHIKVFADVKKKHCAHALTADLELTDVIKQSELFLADGIVITGQFTGVEPAVEDL